MPFSLQALLTQHTKPTYRGKEYGETKSCETIIKLKPWKQFFYLLRLKDNCKNNRQDQPKLHKKVF